MEGRGLSCADSRETTKKVVLKFSIERRKERRG